jgi:hypothetical protein
MEYLIANQRLDLPGLGTFRISEEASHQAEEDSKHKHPAIDFENNPSIKQAPELISFLSSKTGKMKALVSADLDSHLSLAQEFLNIGKPFLFEGIGSLSKKQSGGFSFIPEKQNDHASKEINKTSSTEESFTEHVFSPPREKSNWKKPAAIVLILAGFGIAIWLGYLAYKKRSSNDSIANEINPINITLADSVVNKNDSSTKESTAFLKNKGYKFVIEIANERRAFERFDKLRSYGWDIKMETKDSLRYKLFLLLQMPLSDTSRALDSLTALNGRRVYIEN